MIVVTTSWAPVNDLRNPGIAPYAAPTAIAASRATGMATIPGAWASHAPIAAAARPPVRDWPRAPMLTGPALTADPTPSPARASGAGLTMVEMIAANDPNEHPT